MSQSDLARQMADIVGIEVEEAKMYLAMYGNNLEVD
jgi:hypothetical protein